MKNIIALTLIIPILSACGIVGTAVKTTVDIITLPVDLIVENDADNVEQNSPQNSPKNAMALTQN